MGADPLLAQKTCELHVHTGGCLTAGDLVDLSRDCYREIDWSLFTDAFEDAYGRRVDPIELFEAATKDPANLKAVEDVFVYTEKDGGDFGRFQAKFNLLICVVRYLSDTFGNNAASMRAILNRHRSEGMRLVEYRCMLSRETADSFISKHTQYAQQIHESNKSGRGDDIFRYIISLPRGNSVEAYQWVKRILGDNPQLKEVVVGLDFCHAEEGHPPKLERELFELVATDNDRHAAHQLGIVYHVGESYFDKSLESAIRWCHEAAVYGAKRLGHCIALGLDPAVAVSRRENAHQSELVSERIDQIDYDLTHEASLTKAGVHVDTTLLKQEREQLSQRDGNVTVSRPYNESRLAQVRKRQDYVLGELARLGTVIESCPASNLRIGGVPGPEHHPVHRFLNSDVNLVISADDPGVFACALADEVDWVLEHSGMSAKQMADRLGDPIRFRLHE